MSLSAAQLIASGGHIQIQHRCWYSDLLRDVLSDGDIDSEVVRCRTCQVRHGHGQIVRSSHGGATKHWIALCARAAVLLAVVEIAVCASGTGI